MTATPNLDLDYGSPVPLYFQIAEQVQQAIQRGRIKPGEQLTNEIALADHLHVCRPTLHKAIGRLVGMGLLTQIRGVGTYVQPATFGE